MSRRAWRIDGGQGSLAEEEGKNGEPRCRLSKDVRNGQAGPGVEPLASGPGASRLRRWRVAVSRMSEAGWARLFGMRRARFEDALHRFTGELNEAGNPADVESALLRLTRGLAPTSRIALIRTPEDTDGPTHGGPEGEAMANDADRPVPAWARRHDESMAEVPLHCGVAVHGRLRLLTPERGRGAPRPEALKRLATACTMAAAVLENLRRNVEWVGPAGFEAREDERSRTKTSQPAALIRDATFLSAVLPFALGQARRHREPVSLLCLGIDRLGAIQDLLGPEAADSLVQGVCRVLASSVRSSDIVARLDDDRIVILLVRARGQNAIRIAESICGSIAEMTRDVPELAYATASIGVAEFPTDARNAFALLDAADDALARAQSQGRNQIVTAEVRPMPAAVRIASCTA